MRSRETPVVVICGDVGAPPVPLRLGELAAQLRRELSGVTPLLLPEICEAPQALVEALAAFEPKRVVVGCRADPQRHRELRACLRRAGVAPAGTEIVDLRTADGCSEKVALEQSVTLLSAAAARVAAADVAASVRERTSLSVRGSVSPVSLPRGQHGSPLRRGVAAGALHDWSGLHGLCSGLPAWGAASGGRSSGRRR